MQELRDCEDDMTAEIKLVSGEKVIGPSGNDNTTDVPFDSASSVNMVD
jgi:hypothetical protein